MTTVAQIRGPHTFRTYIAGAATGTDDEWAIVILPNNAKVTGVKWIPNAAITANGTVYSTLTVINKAAGAGTTSVATRSWAATDSVAFTPESMTLSGTAANLLVSAGQLLTIAKTHASTGLTLPDGTVEVTVQWR